MKLFVIETRVADKWIPRYLHKGSFRSILHEAHVEYKDDCCIRVRRVKTLAERKQYTVHFRVNVEDLAVKTEWVN